MPILTGSNVICEKLAQKLEYLQLDNTKLIAKCNQLSSKNKDLVSQNKFIETEISKSEETVDELEIANDNLNDDFRMKKDLLSEGLNYLEATERQIIIFTEKNELLAKRNQKIKKEIDFLTEKLIKDNEDFNSFVESKQKMDGRVSHCEEKLSDLQMEYNKQMEEIESCNQDRLSLEVLKNRVNSNQNRLSEIANNLSRELTKLNEESKNLERKNDSFEDKISSVEFYLREKREEVKNLSQTLDDYIAKVNEI